MTGFPVVSPPANFRCASGAKRKNVGNDKVDNLSHYNANRRIILYAQSQFDPGITSKTRKNEMGNGIREDPMGGIVEEKQRRDCYLLKRSGE